MAALDFPASPTLNQTYTANGRTWTWDGTSWNSTPISNVIVSVVGTANEITATTVSGTTTLSLPSALTFTGKTITGGTFNSGAFNGTVGATTASTGAFTTLSASGNLNFTGTSNRITGDFSGALANRVAFQSSTTNGNTDIQVLPNGTSVISGIRLNGASDSTNSSYARLVCNTASVDLISDRNSGSGTYLPMTFYTGGSERVRIDTAGNVGINKTSPASKLYISTASTTAYGLISQTPTVGLTTGDYVNMAYFADSRGDNNDGLRIISVRDSTGSGSGNWETSSYRIRRSVDQNDGLSGVQEEIVFGTNILGFKINTSDIATITSTGLAVTGALSATGSIKTADTQVIGWGTGNVGFIGSAASNYLRTYINSSLVGEFTSTGLAVTSDSVAGFSTPITATNPSTNAASAAKIAFNGGGTVWGEVGVSYNSNNPYMAFFVRSGSEKMRITDGGNVGIGTSSPAAKLHVRSSTSTVVELLRLDNSGNAADNGAKITWANADQAYDAGYISVIRNASLLSQDMVFATSANWTTTAPSEKVRITGAGNVGIGTTSPAQLFHVNSASASDRVARFSSGSIYGTKLELYSSGTGGRNYEISSTANSATEGGGKFSIYDSTASSTRLVIDSSGNVGIGTTSAYGTLTVSKYNAGGLGGSIWIENSANSLADKSELVFSSGGYARNAIRTVVQSGAPYNGSLLFLYGCNTSSSSLTEAARIDTSGNLLVGTTSVVQSSLLTVNGSLAIDGLTSHAGAGGAYQSNKFNFQWTGSAALWVDTTNIGNIATSSDYRIKKNVTTQTASGLDRVMQLRPVSYEFTDYKELFKADGIVREGFIAHEVQEVIPSGAEGAKDEENQIQSLRVDAILSVTVKAIQELNANLVAQVAALSQRLAALENS